MIRVNWKDWHERKIHKLKHKPYVYTSGGQNNIEIRNTIEVRLSKNRERLFTTGDRHRCGNRRSSCCPNKISGGATSKSCSPNFSCNLHLKVTLQTVRLLLAEKFSKIPQLLGLCPRLHCTLCTLFGDKYLLHKVILWIVFHQFMLPQLKNRSRAYGDRTWFKPIMLLTACTLSLDESLKLWQQPH